MNGSSFIVFFKILMDFPNYFQCMKWRVYFVDIRKKKNLEIKSEMLKVYRKTKGWHSQPTSTNFLSAYLSHMLLAYFPPVN